jgi:AcrR family transcriptional regulator
MAYVAYAQKEGYFAQQRERILTTALELFAKHGFAETPVREIAKRAGLAKGSVYLYFASKDELLEQLITRYALIPELKELVADVYELPVREGLPKLVAQMWQRLRQRKKLARVLLREILGHPVYSALFAKNVAAPANELLGGYLETHMQRGELRHIQAGPAARCLVGMLWMFLLYQELMKSSRSPTLPDEELVSLVCGIFLDGTARS